MQNFTSQKHRRFNPKLAAIFLVSIGFGGLHTSAQTSVNTAGGNSSGTSGSVSYSVGQVVNTTSTGSTGSVQVGIQLPYEISVISGVEQTGINLDFKAYPNPTVDKLFLKMELTAQTPSTYYSLIDNSGKILVTNKAVDAITAISVSKFTAGVYYLKITQNDKLIKTFKIIKK